MAFINFGMANTLAQAKASTNRNKLFFPTNSNSIVIDGKEYGKQPADYQVNYEKTYLTFEAIEAASFTFTGNDLQYSLDNGNSWTTLSSGSASPLINAGQTIMWKQTNLTPGSVNGIGTFSSTGNYKAYGNVMSLIYGDNFIGPKSISIANTFKRLFYYDRKLQNCANIILLAYTLSEGCCYSMFEGCANIAESPVLYVNNYSNYCFCRLFYGCANLRIVKCFTYGTTSSTYFDLWLSDTYNEGIIVRPNDISTSAYPIDGVPANWKYIPAKEYVSIYKYELTSQPFIFGDELYYKKEDKSIYPLIHPDISTQPSILPYRFGNLDIKEILYAAVAYGTLIPFTIIPSNAVIIFATVFNDNEYYGDVTIKKAPTGWQILTPAPWDYALIKYYEKSQTYYSGGDYSGGDDPVVELLSKLTYYNPNLDNPILLSDVGQRGLLQTRSSTLVTITRIAVSDNTLIDDLTITTNNVTWEYNSAAGGYTPTEEVPVPCELIINHPSYEIVQIMIIE